MAMEGGIRDREDDARYEATEWVGELSRAEQLDAAVNTQNDIRVQALEGAVRNV